MIEFPSMLSSIKLRKWYDIFLRTGFFELFHDNIRGHLNFPLTYPGISYLGFLNLIKYVI